MFAPQWTLKQDNLCKCQKLDRKYPLRPFPTHRSFSSNISHTLRYWDEGVENIWPLIAILLKTSVWAIDLDVVGRRKKVVTCAMWKIHLGTWPCWFTFTCMEIKLASFKYMSISHLLIITGKFGFTKLRTRHYSHQQLRQKINWKKKNSTAKI